ncbi:MAG TPA: Uma2 family endonuclease [Gemmataceae bacterium]|nr:Uma2 family endonuclease [Gemmataceae bacterium]
MILTKTKPKIGPQLHGRKMSLKAFEFAQVEDGYLYELARGYIVVSEVPNFPHARRTALIRKHLDHYHVEHPDALYEILVGTECKLLIPEWESERHPDIAVYLAAPKGRQDRTMWRAWVPDLTIEVVSETSRDRDYTEKRDEYWTLGVKEYWIVDAKLEQILILKRGRSRWTERTLGLADCCATKLLPGFKVPCRAIFEAAGEEHDD